MKTARRLISLLLVLCIFVIDLGITAFAESVLALPASLQIINEEAFWGDTSIDTVVLSENIKEIRSRAFANSSLKKINLPNSIIFIADDAFAGLDQIAITATKDTYAYQWAVNRGYIVSDLISSDVFSFLNNDDGSCTLTGYYGDTPISEIPSVSPDGKSVKHIGNYAFYNCRFISGNISIPDSVISIGDYAFYNCENITGIYVFTDNNCTIGQMAFGKCSNLSLVGLPTTIDRINRGVFIGCHNLETVYYFGMDSIQRIDAYAFYGCNKLKDIQLGDNIAFIGQNAFPVSITMHCSEVNCLTMQTALKQGINIQIDSLDYFISDQDYPIDDNLKIQWHVIHSNTNTGEAGVSGWTQTDYLANVKIPAYCNLYVSNLGTSATFTITSIDAYAFRGKKNITSIYIPSTVTAIKRQAFVSCSDLRSIYIPSSVTSIDSEAFDTLGAYNLKKQLTIFGNAGSYAEQWCKDKGYSFVAYGNPPLVEDDDDPEGKIKVSGVVISESCEQIPDVYIFAVNTHNETDTASTVTNADGAWNLYLTLGETYSIEYVSYNYDISGSIETIFSGLTLNAVGKIPGSVNQNNTFTMQQNGQTVNSIVVGTSVDFTVQAAGARYVRLVVDGTLYEQHSVQDGLAQFTREFSVSGNREVKFYMWMDGDDDYSVFTPAQILNVTCENGAMEKANIHEIGTYSLNSGEPLTISWDPVAHADDYTVYIYHDGCRYYPLDTDSKITRTGGETSFTFPESYPLWVSDKWSAQVVTTGEGWDSSSSTAFFSVIATDALAQFTELPQDNEAMLGSSFAVTIGSALSDTALSLTVLPPQDGQSVDISDLGNGRYVIRADHPGTYTLQAFANGASEPADQAEIIVAEPALSQFKQGAYSQYAWYVQGTSISFSVSANFIPDTVALLCDGTAVQTLDNTQAQDSFFIITDPNALNDLGRHTYTICATYGGYSAVTKRPFPVFVMSSNPDFGSTLYAKQDTPLYSYPGHSSGLTLPIYANLEAGEGIYDTLTLIKYKGTEYFVDTNALDNKLAHASLNDDQLIVSSSLDNSENKIVWLQNEQDSKEITFIIRASENVARLRVYECVIPASDYQSPSLNGTGNWIERSENSAFFIYNVTFDRLGCYDVEFAGFDEEGNMVTKYIQAYGQYIPTVLSQASTHAKKYAKCEAFMGHNLTSSPLDKSAVCTVDTSEELTVLGTVGGGYSYVTSSKGNGFIQTDDLLSLPNHSTYRAYILLSEDMYMDVLYYNNEKYEYDNNVYLIAINSWNLIKDLIYDKIKDFHPIMVLDYKVTISRLDYYLDQIIQETDFNDVTYLYINAHGGEKYIQVENIDYSLPEFPKLTWTQLNLSGIKPYTQDHLANKISGIKGKLIFFYESCHSGALLSRLNGFDKSKYSIIMGCQSNESVCGCSLNTMFETTSNERGWYMSVALNKSLISSSEKDLTLSYVYQKAVQKYDTFRNYKQNKVYPYWMQKYEPPEYMNGEWWTYERYEREKSPRQHFQMFGNPDNIVFP